MVVTDYKIEHPHAYKYTEPLDLVKRVEQARREALNSTLFFGEAYMYEMFGHNEQPPVYPI